MFELSGVCISWVIKHIVVNVVYTRGLPSQASRASRASEGARVTVQCGLPRLLCYESSPYGAFVADPGPCVRAVPKFE